MYENDVLHADRQPPGARIRTVDLIAQAIELESGFPLLQISGTDVAFTKARKPNMREV
ncbi:MAG: hypothetical protein AAB325_00775 [Pseudomonadota bacterium]